MLPYGVLTNEICRKNNSSSYGYHSTRLTRPQAFTRKNMHDRRIRHRERSRARRQAREAILLELTAELDSGSD